MTTITYNLTLIGKLDGKYREYEYQFTDVPDNQVIWDTVRWYADIQAMYNRDFEYVTHLVEKVTTTIQREYI